MRYKKVKHFFRFNHKQTFIYLFFFLLFSSLGLGYALISTTLEVDGTANVDDATWDIHFDNIQITSGSVTATTAPTITDNTTVTFGATLENPGDFYEFTIDVVNAGTMNAKIDSLEILPVLTAEQSNYFYYAVTYEDGILVKNGDALNAGATETLKIRFLYCELLDTSLYPTEDMNFNFSVSLNYIQGTGNPVLHPNDFSTDSWETIFEAAQTANLSKYHVGDTKEVDMGDLGVHTIRIANLSLPNECINNDNFSKTACGFVLEFSDSITNYRMHANVPDHSFGYNIGGWQDSEMREYLNTTIYNALPEDFRHAIIPTYVVSGHGSSDSSNFETLDYLYLLSAKEVWGEGDFTINDTAKDNTRQLDYYQNLGVSSSNYSAANKSNNSNMAWYLRTAYSNTDFSYIDVVVGLCANEASGTSLGVSPAFRFGFGDS